MLKLPDLCQTCKNKVVTTVTSNPLEEVVYEEFCRIYKRRIPNTVAKNSICNYYPDKDESLETNLLIGVFSLIGGGFVFLISLISLGAPLQEDFTFQSLLLALFGLLILVIGLMTISGKIKWEKGDGGGCDGCE